MDIFNKLKSKVEKLFSKEEQTQYIAPEENKAGEWEQKIDEAIREIKEKKIAFYALKANDLSCYQSYFVSLPDSEKVAFIIYTVKEAYHYHNARKSYYSEDLQYHQTSVREAIITPFVRTKYAFTEDEYVDILNAFCTYPKYGNILNWPIGTLLVNVEKYVQANSLTPKLKITFEKLLQLIDNDKQSYTEKDRAKLKERLESILFSNSENSQKVKPVHFKPEDDFGVFANELIEKLPQTEKAIWFQLLSLTIKTNGSKPTQKFYTATKDFYKELGIEKFKKVMNTFFEFLISLKDKDTVNYYSYNGLEYAHTSVEFLNPVNQDIIKGLTWICANFYDKTTLYNISKLAERCYNKIPGKGPAAASLGNACIYVLFESKGLEGISHLSRLKLRIKQNNAQKLIQDYLEEAAKKQGITVHEIEEIAVDDYDLSLGESIFEFENFKLRILLSKPGNVEMTWFKADGAEQKSIPKLVTEKYQKKFKQIKDTIKQIEITSTAQRDRLDRLFRSDRTLTWQQFEAYYFNHGLVSTLARKLIWSINCDNKKHVVLFINDKWTNGKGENIIIQPETVQSVSLWHPVQSSLEEIRDWRNFFLNNQINQPVKQAFREVYILTDAEINTRTYSNRMAAHVLKQHQFNSLAKIRGWKYSLLGAFDDGRYNEGATILLPEYQIQAEFWVNEINVNDATNDTGIWLYVATDQVRFVNIKTREPVDLIDVPALAFSEVMRDVDLFVGVASVGNDPTWQDNNGQIGYRDYWQSYSFGDLSEIAKTRKEILERLVPRLKIKDIASIKDKFLVVKGKLRTYKIHIGSTNILMEPNDQYLCIVPNRNQNTENKLFLPFEGDTGLSVIISKALLLAEDDKITDTTITSQINRK